ncbi:hypothetical protein [Candidatus Kryptobacter tengchongensis]|nr:hypothetical protein [Candidatus Kryptobacter tengchongensis]
MQNLRKFRRWKKKESGYLKSYLSFIEKIEKSGTNTSLKIHILIWN